MHLKPEFLLQLQCFYTALLLAYFIFRKQKDGIIFIVIFPVLCAAIFMLLCGLNDFLWPNHGTELLNRVRRKVIDFSFISFIPIAFLMGFGLSFLYLKYLTSQYNDLCWIILLACFLWA